MPTTPLKKEVKKATLIREAICKELNSEGKGMREITVSSNKLYPHRLCF